jgi:hypothetical protein
MNMFMNEDWESAGIFWLPGKQTEFMSGFLTYSVADGLRLRLIGSRPEGTPWTDRHLDSASVLHGYLVQGGLVTIYRSLSMSSQPDLGIGSDKYLNELKHLQFHSTQLSPRMVFMGVHVESPGSLDFDMVGVHLTNLSTWLDRFQVDFNPDFSQQQQQITFTKPEDISLRISSLDAELKIETSWRFEGKQVGKYALTDAPDGVLKHSNILRICPDARRPLSWYQRQLHILNRFLMLCMHKRLFYTAIIGVPDISITPRQSVGVVYWQPDFSYEHRLSPEDMMIRYDDIAGNFSQVLNRFFETFEEMESIYSLLLSEHMHEKTSPTNRFLNLCQALESYHSRMHPQDKIVQKPLYNAQIKQPISELLKDLKIEGLEKELFKEIRDKIMMGVGLANSPNLTTRLYQLLQTVSPGDIGIPDALYFAQRVSKTRNYYTHYSDDADILSMEQMQVAYEQLKLLLIWLIYRDWGLHEDIFFRRLECSSFYQHMAWRQDLVASPPTTENQVPSPAEI